MRDRILRVANWLLARIVPEPEREPLLGDLTEELELRSRASSASAALKWYLRQFCASVPPLLWVRLTRIAWVSTTAVALLAYIAVGVVELAVNWLTSSASASAPYNPLGMLITFPMVVLIVHFATRLRRNAGIVVGTFMLVGVTAMTLWGTESVPLWYRIAYFFAGPAAAFIGSVLRWSRPGREAR
ncbi:MAG TPA: hypothetical protein VN750_23795 [Steroidobacteraceae bacterium]|nr:hypothetical protein [Steroidobacteraceae bacterium]